MEKREIDVKGQNIRQRPAFIKIPYARRILFLPHCLRKDLIKSIKQYAEELGYRVIIAAGGSQVLKAIKEHKPLAVVGIAGMREMFLAVSELNEQKLPFQSIELLSDGCKDTEASIMEAKGILIQHEALPV